MRFSIETRLNCDLKTDFLGIGFAMSKKKMTKSQNSQISEESTQKCNSVYLCAQLYEYADDDWQIEYYAQNPQTCKMKRFRIRVNKIVKRAKNRKEARLQIGKIIESINVKLYNGWNPFFEGEDARLYAKMYDVTDRYLAEKKKELRPDTMRSYSSFVSMLNNWIGRTDKDLYCSMFGRSVAIRFMDFIYNERNVSSRTYNNYTKMARCFFEWCLEKGYCKENPFLQIKLKKKEKKERTIIDADTRKKISAHLAGNPFLLVCMLVYHSLIRPKEIRNLKIGDIDLAGHNIKVSGEIAKNHNTRYSAISPQIESLINDLGIMKKPKSWYIFSDPETLNPGTNKLYDAKFTKEFAKVRKELKLPANMQLYSFRDTGIFEMLKSNVDDLSVMQHADHSSLDITSIYANHYDPNLNQIINAKTPEF